MFTDKPPLNHVNNLSKIPILERSPSENEHQQHDIENFSQSMEPLLSLSSTQIFTSTQTDNQNNMHKDERISSELDMENFSQLMDPFLSLNSSQIFNSTQTDNQNDMYKDKMEDELCEEDLFDEDEIVIEYLNGGEYFDKQETAEIDGENLFEADGNLFLSD